MTDRESCVICELTEMNDELQASNEVLQDKLMGIQEELIIALHRLIECQDIRIEELEDVIFGESLVSKREPCVYCGNSSFTCGCY